MTKAEREAQARVDADAQQIMVEAAAKAMAAAVGIEWAKTLYSVRHHYLYLARAALTVIA